MPTDRNYISFADVDAHQVIEGRTFPDPGINSLEYSDTVKLSHASNVTIRNAVISGGKEDCVDMNRNCSDILIEDCTIIPKGQYGFTIKGGTKNVVLRNLRFAAHGSVTDIDLGNWSDQSMERTTNITIENCTTFDGKPVRVRVLWADAPTVIGPAPVKVTVIPTIFVKIYRFLRARRLVP